MPNETVKPIKNMNKFEFLNTQSPLPNNKLA